MRTVTKTTKNGGPNEAAIKNLMRLQQAYLDALAVSGIPFTGSESYDKDFVGYAKTQGSAEGLDRKYDELDRLKSDFYKEAKRLKELGLVREIRAQKNYYTAPAYSEDIGDSIQRQHGTRYDVYDIVLPPKRKPPKPAPETLNKIGPRPAPSLRGSGELIKPQKPQVVKKEGSEVDDEVKKRRQMIMRGSKYRRKLFGPSKGQMIAKKRKFRK